MANPYYTPNMVNPVPAARPVRRAGWPYALHTSQAVVAGFVGALVATFLIYVTPLLFGMRPADVCTLLGQMYTPQGGPPAFWLGMTIHILGGIVLTLIYACLLLVFRKQSTPGTGFWYGVLLWLLAMILMPFLMAFHPLVQAGRIENPGAFLLDMGQGWTPALFELAAYVAFGLLIGASYKHFGRKPMAPAPLPKGIRWNKKEIHNRQPN